MKMSRSLLNSCRQLLLLHPRHNSSSSAQQRHKPPTVLRSFMYVPASSEKMTKGLLKKRPLPDAIVLDCEDGVAYSAKAKARESARRIVGEGELEECRRTVAVRVNASRTSLAEEDLRCVLDSQRFPQLLVLPKVETVEDLDWLDSQMKQRSAAATAHLPLIAMIESVPALLNMQAIVTAAKQFTTFNLCGVVFGSDDFCSSLGVERSLDGLETLMPRGQFALVARGNQLLAIDKVEIDFKDMEYFKEQCRQGRQLGFTGKQIIHPAQLPACHEKFSPEQSRVEWAQRLCQQFQLHSDSGTGAFVFEGQMIDLPTLRVAENIIAQHKAISEFQSTN